MKFSVLKLLRGRDALGHPINISYKGEETYKTSIGGCCTLSIQILVLVMAVIQLQEVLLMQEPIITSYKHPLSKRDREELGAVNLNEFNAVVGFYTTAVTSQGLVYTPLP